MPTTTMGTPLEYQSFIFIVEVFIRLVLELSDEI